MITIRTQLYSTEEISALLRSFNSLIDEMNAQCKDNSNCKECKYRLLCDHAERARCFLMKELGERRREE